MSWEYSETKHVCPCGSGTYTESVGSSDWGQRSVSWKLDCPACNATYALFTYEYYRHGMSSVGFRWIEKGSYDQAMELLTKAEHLKDRALLLAKCKYLDALMRRFETSSKKAIWEVLHGNMKLYKGLGAFYQHTKGKKRHEYLAELFCDRYMDDVLKLLQISDEEIQAIKREKEYLLKEAEALLRGN